MDSITHCPPVRRIAFQYLMEATQQEGLTGSCLGMHSSQAIKAFKTKRKLAIAASTERNTECKCSLTEKIFEKNLRQRLLFTFLYDKED